MRFIACRIDEWKLRLKVAYIGEGKPYQAHSPQGETKRANIE